MRLARPLGASHRKGNRGRRFVALAAALALVSACGSRANDAQIAEALGTNGGAGGANGAAAAKTGAAGKGPATANATPGAAPADPAAATGDAAAADPAAGDTG